MSRTIQISFFLFLLLPLSVLGQLSPLYSHYMMNGYFINPALAGAEGSEIINISARQQWLGYDGNPKTNLISYQTRILKHRFKLKNNIVSSGKHYIPKNKGRIGVGGYLFSDKNGIIGKTGGQATYAYHLVLGRTGYQLSFGLSGMFYQLKLDQNKMILKDNVDPFIYDAASRNAYVPDFAAGAYIRNHTYFAGISAGQLLQSSIKINGSDLKNYKPKRLYSLIAGMHVYNTSDLDIETSILLKMTEELRTQADLNCRFTLRDIVWLGFTYRSNNDVVTILGFRHNHLFFSYALDYPTTTIRSKNWGTHEISISYKYGTTDRRFRWKERY